MDTTGVPVVAQQKQIQLVSVRIRVRSLASLSGSGICRCHELWCRLQKQLRSFVAVAVTVSCSSDSTPSLGTSICYRSSPKKKKEKKKNRHDYIMLLLSNNWLLTTCKTKFKPISTAETHPHIWLYPPFQSPGSPPLVKTHPPLLPQWIPPHSPKRICSLTPSDHHVWYSCCLEGSFPNLSFCVWWSSTVQGQVQGQLLGKASWGRITWSFSLSKQHINQITAAVCSVIL